MIYKKKNFIFYKRNWENNLKNIKGIMLIKNNNKYEDEWKNDILINGKIIFKNKDIYEGNLLNEIIKYLNGNEYNGECVNNKKEGKGIMKYLNGDEYNGDWKEDLRNGFGKMKYNDRKVYEGY
jgi:hypothetical protein